MYFAAKATQNGVPFYTVDIVDKSEVLRRRIPDGGYAFFHESGEDFLSTTFPRIHRETGKRIAALYLDNFDWIWDAGQLTGGKRPAQLEQMIRRYEQLGLELNNLNCTNTHLKQTLAADGLMAKRAIIIMDDTWRSPETDSYVGKCGASVNYLMVKGWQVVHDNTTKPRKHAVVMTNYARTGASEVEERRWEKPVCKVVR